MGLRYNSPAVQLTLLILFCIFSGYIPTLLTPYIIIEDASDGDRADKLRDYIKGWEGRLTTALSSIVGIFVTNLGGVKLTLFITGITNIILSTSVLIYNTRFDDSSANTFLLVSIILSYIGSSLSHIVTLQMVLSYPPEKYKARTLSLIVLIENIFAIVSDVIYTRSNHSQYSQHAAACTLLAFSCLSPIFAFLILQPDKVVRDNGIYLIAKQTTIRTEFTALAKLLIHTPVVCLIPYFFFCSFTYSSAGTDFTDFASVILHDSGCISVLALAVLLDCTNLSRRARGIYGFCVVVVLAIIGVVLNITLRTRDVDYNVVRGFGFLAQTSPLSKYYSERYTTLSRTAVFFDGASETGAYVLALWIIGSLTNETRALARLAAVFIVTWSVGKLTGIQCSQPRLDEKGIFKSVPVVPLYISMSGMALSFAVVFKFIVCRIPETNNWFLAEIEAIGAVPKYRPPMTATITTSSAIPSHCLSTECSQSINAPSTAPMLSELRDPPVRTFSIDVKR